VDILRRSADVPPIVEQAIKLKIANGLPYVIWMQQGIFNAQAAKMAHKASLTVVMDRCIMVEHKRFSTSAGKLDEAKHK
jgi:predicted CoA-binding protein